MKPTSPTPSTTLCAIAQIPGTPQADIFVSGLISDGGEANLLPALESQKVVILTLAQAHRRQIISGRTLALRRVRREAPQGVAVRLAKPIWVKLQFLSEDSSFRDQGLITDFVADLAFNEDNSHRSSGTERRFLKPVSGLEISDATRGERCIT